MLEGNNVKQGEADANDFYGSNKVNSQCLFEIANLLLACYHLKFCVFITCLMTKAINSSTLFISN